MALVSVFQGAARQVPSHSRRSAGTHARSEHPQRTAGSVCVARQAPVPARALQPARVARALTVAAASAQSYRSKDPKDITVAVFGSTGYIGQKVTKEMIARGFSVVAVAREQSGIGGKQGRADVQAMFPDATVKFSDVTDVEKLKTDVFDTPVDVVMCCLASRTGGIKDSWLVDYQATRNCLDAAVAAGTSHYVLLSAICVQKPLLEFQKAKLKFEADLQATDALTHSIVRPTAFFKSLAGQVESVKKGGPYVMFGDGHLAACKPISEEDLAAFMGDCVLEEDKVNKVLPIGGPGEAMDPVQQADVLFKLIGSEPKTLKVPVGIMDFVIGTLDGLGKLFPNLKEAAEFGRIGKYYATESMLVYDDKTGKYDADATPSYGKETLEMFFDRVLKEGLGGQELGDQAVWGQK
eukprot:jgi/Ulvmu1/3120/UM015_0160.1